MIPFVHRHLLLLFVVVMLVLVVVKLIVVGEAIVLVVVMAMTVSISVPNNTYIFWNTNTKYLVKTNISIKALLLQQWIKIKTKSHMV